MPARRAAVLAATALLAATAPPRVARAQTAPDAGASPDAAVAAEAPAPSSPDATATVTVGEATAPAPGDDVLTLRDGTVLRGRVTSVAVGDRAVIELAGGASREVPWRAIAQAEGPAFEHASGTAPATPPPTPAPPDNDPSRADFTRPAPGRVPLRVESDGAIAQRVGVTLSLEAQGTGFESRLFMQHRVLCATPCTLYVPPGPFALYTGARGVVETTTQLVVPRAGLRAVMYAPSPERDAVATALLSTSALAGLIGVILLAATFSTAGPPDAAEITSLALIGAAGALLPIGLLLAANNHRGVRVLVPGGASAASLPQ